LGIAVVTAHQASDIDGLAFKSRGRIDGEVWKVAAEDTNYETLGVILKLVKKFCSIGIGVCVANGESDGLVVSDIVGSLGGRDDV